MNPTSSRKALALLLIGAGLALAPALSDAQTAAKAVVAKPERYKPVLQVSDADPAKSNLQASEMHKGVRHVDAGVVHIMKRQREDRLT